MLVQQGSRRSWKEDSNKMGIILISDSCCFLSYSKNLIFLDFDFFIVLENIDDVDVRFNYEPFNWSKSILCCFFFSLIYFLYFRVS